LLGGFFFFIIILGRFSTDVTILVSFLQSRHSDLILILQSKYAILGSEQNEEHYAMASRISRKRARVVRRTPRKTPSANERYLVDASGKRIAVVLDLAEYRRLVTGKQATTRMSTTRRAELVAKAKQAKGSWKASEGTGTSVEIVRGLRDEWERK
jgi:hypothetical protein